MYAVVISLFQLIFIFPLFLGIVMYANEFKAKEKQKLTEIKISYYIYNNIAKTQVFGKSILKVSAAKRLRYAAKPLVAN